MPLLLVCELNSGGPTFPQTSENVAGKKRLCRRVFLRFLTRELWKVSSLNNKDDKLAALQATRPVATGSAAGVPFSAPQTHESQMHEKSILKVFLKK